MTGIPDGSLASSTYWYTLAKKSAQAGFEKSCRQRARHYNTRAQHKMREGKGKEDAREGKKQQQVPLVVE